MEKHKHILILRGSKLGIVLKGTFMEALLKENTIDYKITVGEDCIIFYFEYNLDSVMKGFK